jgi:hypothetical protein
MMSYPQEVLAQARKRDAHETEFLQAVEEVLIAIAPVLFRILEQHMTTTRRQIVVQRQAANDRLRGFLAPFLAQPVDPGVERDIFPWPCANHLGHRVGHSPVMAQLGLEPLVEQMIQWGNQFGSFTSQICGLVGVLAQVKKHQIIEGIETWMVGADEKLIRGAHGALTGASG